jgi:hypothetical protein
VRLPCIEQVDVRTFHWALPSQCRRFGGGRETARRPIR